MKVILIEDQILLSTTLADALGKYDDIEVIGQSDKASDALKLCDSLDPDIVIMDIYTRDGNGLEATVKIKEAYPNIKVMVMTGVEDERLVPAAKESGADLFVWKSIPLEEMVELIRASQKPYKIFPETSKANQNPLKFNKTEINILRLIAKGMTTREISTELFLSYGTVRLYISRMYGTTGFKSRAKLVAYALKNGFIKYE